MNLLVKCSSVIPLHSLKLPHKSLHQVNYVCVHCLKRHLATAREDRIYPISAENSELFLKTKVHIEDPVRKIQSHYESICFEPMLVLPTENASHFVDNLIYKSENNAVNVNSRVSLQNDKLNCRTSRNLSNNYGWTTEKHNTIPSGIQMLNILPKANHRSASTATKLKIMNSPNLKKPLIITKLNETPDVVVMSETKNIYQADFYEKRGNSQAKSSEKADIFGYDPAKQLQALKKKSILKRNLKNDIKEETAQLKSEKERRRIKTAAFLKTNLLDFMDVCINNDMMDIALKKLKYYRKQFNLDYNHTLIKDLHLYNMLLQNYSKQGNVEKMRDLILMIKEDGLKLDCFSYATILSCLGRSSKPNVKSTAKIIEEIKSKDFSLSDLLTKTDLNIDEKEIVLTQIRKILPSFQPSLDLNVLLNNPLTETLYSGSRNYESCLNVGHDIDFKKIFHEQLKNEKLGFVSIDSVEKTSRSKSSAVIIDKVKELKNTWRNAITEGFKKELRVLELEMKHDKLNNISVYPFLKCLPEEEFVEFILMEIEKLLQGSAFFSLSCKELYMALGKRIFNRYQVHCQTNNGAIRKLENVFELYATKIGSTNYSLGSRELWNQMAQDYSKDFNKVKPRTGWSPYFCYNVGKFLYSVMLTNVQVGSDLSPGSKGPTSPVFYSVLRQRMKGSKEEIKVLPTIARAFREMGRSSLRFPVDELPMTCPPIPWVDLYTGGYLILKTGLTRTSHFRSTVNTLGSTTAHEIVPILDSLNQLGNVAWTVNEPVLDVILEVFRNGGSEELDVPMPPELLKTPHTEALDDLEERVESYAGRKLSRQKRADMYGLWCTALYRLSIANHHRKKVFWLPCNLDFRGRVYPIAPHMNHLGCDLSRSLLLFGKSKPLGKRGLRWLKIHIVNLTGTHKLKSNLERLLYADKILPHILDSAERPLQGKRWWTTWDEPWQVLAACMELRNALASPDPEKYETRFPVHQDGSCNGLQHYAALGRDLDGGRSVNLTDQTVPQDVYTTLVELVERERASDARKGVEIAQILEGHIKRKTIKQTIMTTVYGVTRYGASLQIKKQLQDQGKLSERDQTLASRYLTIKTFDCIEEIFTSARMIQHWFNESACLICNTKGNCVGWVTPLGLHVNQPYQKAPKRSWSDVKQNWQFHGEWLANLRKQRNAFAPNFVHSLDSTHMMLTSLHCEQKDVSFASVHDCFWTHPATVDKMNRICREQFVTLYQKPILNNLRNHFLREYGLKDSDLKPLPEEGSLDINEVLKSEYFFS